MPEIDWKNVSCFEGPEESPGFLLWQVSTEWRRQMELALSTLGLTHPQFVLLASVSWLTRQGNCISQIELARHCKTDITMTSQILRILEKKGYVERVRRPGDERSKYPKATPLGVKVIEKAIPLVESADRNFFKASKKEMRSLVKILQELVRDE
jgi:DNA-binding MarR family transcriptional regulator